MEKIIETERPLVIRNRLYTVSEAPRGEARYWLIGSQRVATESCYTYRQEWTGMVSLP
jgi:hypothetical protein